MYIGVSFCICLFILQVFLGPQLLISKFQRTHAFLCRVCNTLTQKIYANNISFLKHSFLACWRQSKQVADILKSNPAQRVYINGHASEEGNKRANQILSDRRAETIANLLKALGVPAEQPEVKNKYKEENIGIFLKNIII